MATTQRINLFIDANIWLSLFHFTNDDLEQFKKLKMMLGHGLKIFVPEQIKNEVYRNRENKIKDALDKFEKFDLQFPAYIKNYNEYADFSEKFRELKKQHKEWLAKIKLDIANQNSPADIAIREFFETIEIIPSTPILVQRGVSRYNIGNPPGKNNKYGDAINWETLLEAVPDGEDLFFVSADKDYTSLFDVNSFHPFLAQEWSEKKHARIIFYKSLVDFFKQHIKEIELRAESEKADLIEWLSNSGSFKTTHKVIAELANYTDWSLQQIQEICSATVQNSQVFWVLPDEDVYKFFSSLLEHPTVKKCNDAAIQKIQGELIRIDSEQNDNEQLDRDWLQ